MCEMHSNRQLIAPEKPRKVEELETDSKLAANNNVNNG